MRHFVKHLSSRVAKRRDPSSRRGVVSVLSAFLLVGVFAFVAFAVDTGLMTLTQTEMQNAVDAAALAASQEITGAIYDAGQGGGDATVDANSIAVVNAREMAAEVAGLNVSTSIRTKTWPLESGPTTQPPAHGQLNGVLSLITW